MRVFDSLITDDTKCPLCNLRYRGPVPLCDSCQKKYSELVRDGRLPEGVDYSDWMHSILLTRKLRKRGVPDEEILRDHIQPEFDRLHQVWLNKHSGQTKPILSADDLEKDLLY